MFVFVVNEMLVCRPVMLSALKCMQEVAASVEQDFGSIDILVHSLANGPEVYFLQNVTFSMYELLITFYSNKTI